MKTLITLLLLTTGVMAGAIGQSTNSLSLLSSDKSGGKLQVTMDLSDLDSRALEELQRGREVILANYPSIESMNIDSKKKRAVAVSKTVEMQGEDVVMMFQSTITSNEDRELQDQYREAVKKAKAKQQ